MSSEDRQRTGGGIGFCGMLAILFIGLKLAGVVSWPWWAVLAPLWVPFALVCVLIVVLLAIGS